MLKEELAALCHESWSNWMQYLFVKSRVNIDGSVTIPQPLAEQWQRQLTTLYASLPEPEKESDRRQADKIIALFVQHL